jgi:uncharacterized protein with ParB-like and HNH nuclease domain
MNAGERLFNKIDADDETVSELLSDKKFIIDYFQREYRWTEKQISQLVEDLTDTFLKSYKIDDERSAVADYQSYFLGSVVFYVASSGHKSIIDGQQRITSLTLFLIYLRNRQKELSEEQRATIEQLIFSDTFGAKSFNIVDEDRQICMNSLYEFGEYSIRPEDNETVVSLAERYDDIQNSFPEDDIDLAALPYFIDWLKHKVILVRIDAYSEDNAYIIFETMNDRGLNLTPTEMLKGYVLTQIKDKEKRDEINEIWKKEIQKLHEFGKDIDLAFFQSWFRGKYAESMRQGKAGSENMDFEIIGSKFHGWFKEKYEEGLFCPPTSTGIYTFFKEEFPFFVKAFIKTLISRSKLMQNAPHLHYICNWGIAYSLQHPLLLSPVCLGDNEATVDRKLDLVAQFIETYSVRRSINYRQFRQSTIKYTMFNILKRIRSSSISELCINLSEETNSLPETFQGVMDFGLAGNNKSFVKHLLSRITGYLDELVGKNSSYDSYYKPLKKPFEIEHLWADKWREHIGEIAQESDFKVWRNKIGALILLPQGTNQSFSSNSYTDKLTHYIKENTYAQTLCPAYYEKNPNFLNNETVKQLNFEAFPNMTKTDIEKRTELVLRICENIWPSEYC